MGNVRFSSYADLGLVILSERCHWVLVIKCSLGYSGGSWLSYFFMSKGHHFWGVYPSQVVTLISYHTVSVNLYVLSQLEFLFLRQKYHDEKGNLEKKGFTSPSRLSSVQGSQGRNTSQALETGAG